ncbi:hypothetical protein LguiB_024512 [Lonicera macranthoides]
MGRKGSEAIISKQPRKEVNSQSHIWSTRMQISALQNDKSLATGNRAKLMVQITTKGPTPLTMALAVAAKEIYRRPAYLHI